MSAAPNAALQENEGKKCEVRLLDGSKIICDSEADAELVLDADRRHYEGNSGRTLPRQTLEALERAGIANSLLYRSAMRHLAKE